jgi:hypothetical protein
MWLALLGGMPAPRTPEETTALVRSILDTHHALLERELPRLRAGLRGAHPAVRGVAG